MDLLNDQNKRKGFKGKRRETGERKNRASKPQSPEREVSPILNMSHLPTDWPILTEREAKRLELMFNRHKQIISSKDSVSTWKFGNRKPQTERMYYFNNCVPTKVLFEDMFVFGMSECYDAVHKNICWAVVVEAQVSPRKIMLPIVELCATVNAPLVCMPDLKRITSSHFNKLTSCLGIKKGCLTELRQEIMKISNAYQAKSMPKKRKNKDSIKKSLDIDAVEGGHNSKMQSNDVRDQPGPSGMAGNKAQCPQTVTSETVEKPPIPTFKLVVRKPTSRSDKRAWLDLDEKEVVDMSD